MKKFVKLPFYNTLSKNLNSNVNLIQVILGPRQVGKTTTVLELLKSDFNQKYLFYSADAQLGISFNWLNDCWNEARKSAKLLVIDEIQKLENWAEIVKKLWDEDRKNNIELKVLLLGSSSLEIQRGLSESLTGRFELIRAFHWSFEETRQLKKISFEEYLQYGGYPKSYSFLEDEDKFLNYIENSIVKTVIEKDILANHKVKSPALFKQAFEIILNYPAQEISYSKLLGQIQDKGNVDLVKYYISLYEGTFLMKSIHKYSGKVIKLKTSSPKLIPMCPVLYYLTVQSPYRTDEKGRVFEAVVGAKLARLPFELYYWREGKFEVDYVLKKGRRLIAIEVKSGRRKNQRGLEEFQKKFPESEVYFITPENLESFSI